MYLGRKNKDGSAVGGAVGLRLYLLHRQKAGFLMTWLIYTYTQACRQNCMNAHADLHIFVNTRRQNDFS